MSNSNVTMQNTYHRREIREKVGFPQRLLRWMKYLLLFPLAFLFIIGVLFISGKFLTNRLETETNTHALAPWGPGTSFLSLSSGETHYLDVGEGDVILLIHGSSGSIADWQENVAYRLAESHRVVAFDSYGFGLSERNDSFEYGFDLWTQQAIEVLDALEIEQVVVLGHSAGAVPAVALGAYYPERVRGVILSGHGFAMDPAQMVPLLPGIGEIWAARQTVIGDTYSESYREQAEAVHRIRGTRAAYLSFVRNQVLVLTTARGRQIATTIYEAIEAPVLQMHGTHDQSQTIESARGLSPRLADSRFVAIEGSDHHIHNEAPDQWLETVTTFMDSISQ